MQGIYINGVRPTFKKDVKTYIEEGQDLAGIMIEATSMFGNEFDGSLASALTSDHPNRTGPFYIVGPDPHTDRKWYLTLSYNANKSQWEVK